MTGMRFKVNDNEIDFRLDKKTWHWKIYLEKDGPPMMKVTHAKGNAIIRFIEALKEFENNDTEQKQV